MVLRINSHLSEVEQLATSLRGAALTLGADADTADDIERAMVEVATNIVRHGYAVDKPGPIKLTVSRRGETLRVDLLDQAAAIPQSVIDGLCHDHSNFPGTFAAPPLDPEDMALDALPEGGMGLLLIGASVDRVTICRRCGVNRLRMIKSLSPAPPSDASTGSPSHE